ncbi:hypothetical protein D3C71_1916720 [compost metagenome]
MRIAPTADFTACQRKPHIALKSPRKRAPRARKTLVMTLMAPVIRSMAAPNT